MLECKSQTHVDTKEQETKMNYSMTPAFQLVTGEPALSFSKSTTMIPVVWHQRKKLMTQNFSEPLGRLQLWLLQAQACFSFQCGNTAIACTKGPHSSFGSTLTQGRMLLRCTIAALNHKRCTNGNCFTINVTWWHNAVTESIKHPSWPQRWSLPPADTEAKFRALFPRTNAQDSVSFWMWHS